MLTADEFTVYVHTVSDPFTVCRKPVSPVTAPADTVQAWDQTSASLVTKTLRFMRWRTDVPAAVTKEETAQIAVFATAAQVEKP